MVCFGGCSLLYFAFISVCFNICPLFLDLYTLLGGSKNWICCAHLNFVDLVLTEEYFKGGVQTGKRKLCSFDSSLFYTWKLVVLVQGAWLVKSCAYDFTFSYSTLLIFSWTLPDKVRLITGDTLQSVSFMFGYLAEDRTTVHWMWDLWRWCAWGFGLLCSQTEMVGKWPSMPWSSVSVCESSLWVKKIPHCISFS